LRVIANDPKTLIKHQQLLGLRNGAKAIEHMTTLMKVIRNRDRFDKVAIGLLDYMWGRVNLYKAKQGRM
jgi:hypothetical protein